VSSTENRTELGNARRLVRLFGHRIGYVHPWRRWLVYDGIRWAPDETGELERLAKETVLSIYREALAAESDTERSELAKWAARCESHAQLRAMIDLAASEPGIPAVPDELDADPWVLNVENGTLDLRRGLLRAHEPADLITKFAPVAWDPAAPAPAWAGFLERILPGDPALFGFLQRAIGYSLTGNTGEQTLFFLHGRGSNGKSTLLETLRALLGDYGMQADAGTFLDRRRDGANNDLARLRSARFVAAIKAGEGQRLAEALVKTVTGGDTISARLLYSEFFEFRPQFKLWLAANHKPVIRGTDYAMWRRIPLWAVMQHKVGTCPGPGVCPLCPGLSTTGSRLDAARALARDGQLLRLDGDAKPLHSDSLRRVRCATCVPYCRKGNRGRSPR
jgi:putative DNA primase/helicase